PAMSVASVGNAKNEKPECDQRRRRHFRECWGKSNNQACYSCGSRNHFIKDCPDLAEKDNVQNPGQDGNVSQGRPPKNSGNVSGSQRGTKDTTIRSEARAPARTYAIRARKESSSPDVITGTFTLYDTSKIALIDPGSTHS
ncbi:hypothetical protein FGF82_23560, partial [Salmonella sp. gx-f9]|nr:hypothetical protein [Salmonella sp. gx-f9]